MISLSLHALDVRVRLIARPVLIGSVPDLIHILGLWKPALWEFQVRHQGALPSQPEQAVELESIQATLINERIENKSILKGSSKDLIALVHLSQSDRGEKLRTIPTLGIFSYRSLSTTAAHEFSPVCAVVGGVLAQDILNALSARETPISNLFVFDGTTGSGHTAMLMNPPLQ